MSAPKKRIVVLISGSGSNLQALIDAAQDADFPGEVVGVISNRPDAFGLVRAERAGIPGVALDHKAFDGREAFEVQLQTQIDGFRPDLIVLAGFMRILTPSFVSRYLGRMLNIHPSLLPKYQGLHTHRRALEAGDLEHGTTVHFVTPELDGGPVVIHARVPVQPGDCESSLAERVLVQEHKIYPIAVRWFLEQRLALRGNKAWLDDVCLPSTGSAYLD